MKNIKKYILGIGGVSGTIPTSIITKLLTRNNIMATKKEDLLSGSYAKTVRCQDRNEKSRANST